MTQQNQQLHQFGKLLRGSIALLILALMTGVSIAQPEQNMMMDGCMMMSGWGMVVYVIFGILLFIVLILAILALWKYLFGKKT